MSATLLLESQFTASSPRRFRKDVLRVGRWKHPITGQDVEITPLRLQRLAGATRAFLRTQDRRALPFQDGHCWDSMKTLGWWDSFHVDGDRLVGEVDVTDTAARRKIIEGSLRSVSVRIDSDVKDSAGTSYEEVISHVAATPAPVIDGQQDFVALAAEPGDVFHYEPSIAERVLRRINPEQFEGGA